MSQSNAPGETRKLPTEWARLTIQMDVQFTQEGVRELAPQWDKTGVSALRALIEKVNAENLVFSVMKDILEMAGFTDKVMIDNPMVTVGR